MKFEEVLPALREGKKIRRKTYLPGYYICLEGKVIKGFLPDSICLKFTHDMIFSMQMEILARAMQHGLLADDWEIVEEKKKVKLRDLTEKQYQKWFNANCPTQNKDKTIDDCLKCIFHDVVCNALISRCWSNHKDLYSDKFLDQEIEIEE